ncbi:MAG TPA: hypothetical protein GX698_01225 [Acholeplasmataceae bacterium]|nr:hypothetical protein [Acholeplasmataceae bacterium]
MKSSAFVQNERNNLTASIITIIKLKELGVKHITARADEEDYATILKPKDDIFIFGRKKDLLKVINVFNK